MSVARFESILAQVRQLPAAERAQLLAELSREARYESIIPEARIIGTNEPYLDRAREYEWLAQHRGECYGQWIALMGDQLVAHGSVAKNVFAEARKLGYARALFTFVENEDMPFVNV